VDRALAADRAARITALACAVELDIPADPDQPVAARVTLTFDLSDDTRPLAIDFDAPAAHLRASTANGTPFAPALACGHPIIPAALLTAGRNLVHFEVIAGDTALNRQSDYCYSLFVPSRASRTFPCFDQPDLKARWRVTMTVPSSWAAVANGAELSRWDDGDRATVAFGETEPLPTYLVALVAGRFSIETRTAAGRTMRMFHRESDAGLLARNREDIFEQHQAALGWLERYTGIPYPFGSFDFVLIPSFQFSGMEHPGAIYYDAARLLLDPAATRGQELARAGVIAHETAHMWFGNLVTMAWFDDVWMKEVFAGYCASQIVRPSFPDLDHDLRFFLEHYPAAYGVDRTAGAHPIRQTLTNLDDAGTLYGPIIYDKAPIVLAQLERLVGPEVFDTSVRAYLSGHRYGNAGWPDLLREIDARTDRDVSAWSRAWIDEPGRPRIRTRLDVRDGRLQRMTLVADDPTGRDRLWPQTVSVAVGRPEGIDDFDVLLEGPETVVSHGLGEPAPDWVLPSGGGRGYGLFEIDEASRAWLLGHLGRVPSPLARGVAIVTLYDEMLEGRIRPAVLTESLLAALPNEDGELNLERMLRDLRIVYWRFTDEALRPAVASRVEPVLRAGISGARSTRMRAAWFEALRSMATTPPTLAWLERVWRREVSIPGLPLAERAEADLAAALALRQVPNASTILREQRARLTNPDVEARFAFTLPALSPDRAERSRFAARLEALPPDVPEAWIIDGLGYLHHPLRASTSRQYVVPALARLPETQHFGDIFFPKRWTDAVLSGHRAPATARSVAAFIDGLPPDHPPRLRKLLLTAADPLFRAAGLRPGH